MAVSFAELPRVGRKLRQPEHTWAVKHLPFAIQPFMIAPVLPGETLKNCLIQCRAVTQPVKSALSGWWLEHYLFYVKHRDLGDSATLVNMMLDPAVKAPNQASTDITLYSSSGRPRYVAQCLQAVVATWFRDRGEAWNAFLIGTLPAAKLQKEYWAQSANTVALSNAGDFAADLDANSTIMASEVSAAYERWQFLRANNLTDATYEDYLRSYGVRVELEEENQPELLRYSRDWVYPSNTVDPATGSPSSAVSWVVSERADKDRFFKEPGFIFGVTVCRPKVFRSGQAATAVQLLDDAYAWLPAILRDDPMTSVRPVTPAGMVPSATANQIVDLRDLFLYGDQFVNYDVVASPDSGAVALPTGVNWRYPTKAMVDALFVPASPYGVLQDGVARLSILGALVDHTPRGNVAGMSA